MTTFRDCEVEEQARLEAAAAWCLRLRRAPSCELSADFQSWIQDPENKSALRAIEESSLALEEFGASPELLDMRRTALTRARRMGAKRWVPRSALGQVAAAAVLILVVGGGTTFALWRDRTTYLTEVGERRVVSLPDGSRISMDAASRIRVHYTESARVLILDRGRARFDVAHDITRPFTVTAGSETVVAVGTSFSVERLGQQTLVTLFQGEVAVKNEIGFLEPIIRSVEPVKLTAGEELIAVKELKPSVRPVNFQTATAWEAGQLVFKDERLDDALLRVNRYTERRIEASPSVGMIRISGVFNAGDIGAFVSAVTGYFPVRSTNTADGKILLESKP